MSQLLLQRLSKLSPRNSSLIQERARRVLSSSATATNPCVLLEISADLNQDGGPVTGNVLMFDAAKQDLLIVERTIPEAAMIVEGKGVGASHGWLFMEDQRDRSLSVTDVLNPYKTETTVIPLPPLTCLPLCQNKVECNVAMSYSPPHDDSDEDWVVAIKFLGRQLSLCRPRRDLRWTNIPTPLLGYLDNSNLMYSKRDKCFYLPSPGGHHLFSYDIKDKDHPKFHVLQFRDLPELSQSEWEEILMGSCCRTEYLVESASTGEHFLVKRYIQAYFKNGQDYKTKQFMVFREEETLQGGRYMCYTDNIGDICIFISSSEAFCVQASSFPGLKPNSIYYIGQGFGIYDLTTGTSTPFQGAPTKLSDSFWLPPFSI